MEGLGEEEITVVKRDDDAFEGTYEYGNYNYTVQGETEEIVRQNAEHMKEKIDKGCKSDSIGDNAFCSCSSLTQITIPSGVTEIGNFAFLECSSLTQITIPDSVKSIGNSAFFSCVHLTQITIPSSVKSIGNSAFFGCIDLTQIEIPSSVTSIGDMAFSGCSSLTQITLPRSFFRSENEESLRKRLGIPEEAKIICENEKVAQIPSPVVEIPDDSKKTICTGKLKNGLIIGFWSFLAIACAGLGIGLFFVPVAQFVAPVLLKMSLSILATQLISFSIGAFSLMTIAQARKTASINEFFLPFVLPFKLIGEILRGVAEIVLSLLSPFLPNKLLAKAYERLHNPICQKEDRISCNILERLQVKSFGQKALAVARNIGVGLVTAVANTGILLGRFAIEIAKLAVAVFIKPVATNKFAEKIDNAFAEAEDSMDNATCGVNNLLINLCSVVMSSNYGPNSVVNQAGDLVRGDDQKSDIYYHLRVAQYKSKKFNAGQPSPENNRSTLLRE